MPHVVIEYSAGLDKAHDLQALCGAVFAALAAHAAIPDPTTLKIRAAPVTYWKTGTDPQSFVHANLALLPGRDQTTKDALTACILSVLSHELPGVGSLSVDAGDLSPAYIKNVL